MEAFVIVAAVVAMAFWARRQATAGNSAGGGTGNGGTGNNGISWPDTMTGGPYPITCPHCGRIIEIVGTPVVPKHNKPNGTPCPFTGWVNTYSKVMMDAIEIGSKPAPDARPEQPTEPLAGSPQKPDSIPTPGRFYQSRTGDFSTRVMSRAGLPANKWRVMRDHVENAWCRMPDGSDIRWFARWSPAYRGQWMPNSAYNFPIVYIPRQDEVV